MLCPDPAFGDEDLELPNAYQAHIPQEHCMRPTSTGLHAQFCLSCVSVPHSLSTHSKDHNGKIPRVRKANFSLAWCDDTSVRLKALKDINVSMGRCELLLLRHLVHQTMSYNGRLTQHCEVAILIISMMPFRISCVCTIPHMLRSCCC